jgi:pyrimidine-nucleoside phosphorylase
MAILCEEEMRVRAVDIIQKHREVIALSAEEIDWLIQGFVAGDIPDYQMSAFLMAVCFSGMNDRETADLTLAMMRSGDIVDLSDIPGVKVDKPSTGGGGDTTTLGVSPLVAACGGRVAKMSGRGLGHTGGTLDKLESIPGFQVELPMQRFKEQVKSLGLAVVGQSQNLDPADKKLYALRDVTGTVRSIPLIASSVMSKKLAAGADAIVLDVKVGTGAFVGTLEEAKKLAATMVEIGKRLGRRVTAVITDMNQPLGMAVGNALEVREAVELLSGKIPAGDPLYEVCLLLASHMLLLSGLADTEKDARDMLVQALSSGAALNKLKDMAAAQGADVKYIDAEKVNELCAVKSKIPVTLQSGGRVRRMDAYKIGVAAQLLGAGRAKKEDSVDHAVGLVMHKRLGDTVAPDDPICTLYVNDERNVEAATALLREAISLEEGGTSMVYGVLQ